MSTKISAYLTVFNDWDILELALRSIAPFVDELVVADGAYEWMAPYYKALGQNPEKSDPRVYEAIEASGIPYRIVSRLWSDQVEKRTAGYEACNGRYICRIDADEVIFFNERALEKFFANSEAVGAVEMPTYIAPGWMSVADRNRLVTSSPLPRQSFLFDRSRIAAEVHLNYLWLVMQNLPRQGEKPFRVSATPIGFNAHLTQWRTAENSARRAEYYTLNYMRQKGVPWIPELREKQIDDFGRFFDLVEPASFRDIMLTSRVAPQRLKEIERAKRSPLTSDQETAIGSCYGQRLASLGELNRKMATAGLQFASNLPIIIDISDPICSDPVMPDDILLLEFSEVVSVSSAEVYTVLSHAPWDSICDLKFRSSGKFVAIQLPPYELSWEKALRRQIEVRVAKRKSALIQRFKVRTERPLPPGLFLNLRTKRHYLILRKYSLQKLLCVAQVSPQRLGGVDKMIDA